ncbi:hypothetical protein ACE38F_12020 [Bacillus mycoides]|uniref:hypothetical protein n=1 Tax=Bacillus mycoides TaxID=1405 RepID=UPI0035CB75FC
MTKDLIQLINDLNENWELIGDFFDNPEKVIATYELSEIERHALISRNLDDLNQLGINDQLAVGALSGAHSSGCHM